MWGYTPRLWLARQLVPLVAVEATAAAQFVPQPSASAMESDLDRLHADVESIGDVVVRESLVLTQDHNRAIGGRQARNVAVDAVVHFSSNKCLFHAWRLIRHRCLVVDRHVALVVE